VFPILKQNSKADLARLVNVNLGTDANSTIIEHKLHLALFGDQSWQEETHDATARIDVEKLVEDSEFQPPYVPENEHEKGMEV